MMANPGHTLSMLAALVVVLLAFSALGVAHPAYFGSSAEAAPPAEVPKPREVQRKRRPAQETPPAKAPAPPVEQGAPAADALAQREKVEADVSARSIAVTSGFTGTEIIVFGSVNNTRQTSAEAGYYDIAVVVEGASAPLLARRKSNVAGLWINTASAAFEGVPTYYALASTRPIEEIADAAVLERNAIGLDYVRLAPAATTAMDLSPQDLKSYKDAVVRLKEKEGIYLKSDYAVAFVGRGLFRSTISLPPNVPVGPLTARVYLFRDGELLSTFSTRVKLEREGIELWLYRFAFRHSVAYGISSVVLGVAAGFLAAFLFRPRR
jgi:uncharacterized protein (TIGR02186 family)